MENKLSENEQLLHKLNMIFYALVGAPLLLFVFLYLNINDGKVFIKPLDAEFVNVLLVILPVISLIIVLAGFIVYFRQIKVARALEGQAAKMQAFFNASMLKYACLETGSFIAVLGYFLTSHVVFTGLYVAFLLIFSINRPTRYRMYKDLRLKQRERKNIFE